jgi:hypothetical protein
MTLIHRDLGVTLTVKLVDESARCWIVQTPGLEEQGPYVLMKNRWKKE